MSKDSFIWLFGRKVKAVKRDDYSCNGCALKDICDSLYTTSSLVVDPCNTGDDSRQKFVSVD